MVVAPGETTTVLDVCPAVSMVRFESAAEPAVVRLFSFVPSSASTVFS